MTTKIKTTLLTVFFLFGLLTCIQAQEKYEYAKMTYIQNTIGQPMRLIITIAKENTELQIIKLKKEDVASLDYLDSSPFFKQLRKMLDEGWELYALEPNSYGDIAYLKKKK